MDPVTGEIHDCDWPFLRWFRATSFCRAVIGLRVPTADSRCEAVFEDAWADADGVGCNFRVRFECQEQKLFAEARKAGARCGRDITKSLGRLKAAIDQVWAADVGFYGPGGDPDLCSGNPANLMGVFNVANGWDICELAWDKQRFCSEEHECCKEGCKNTVMVSNECWPSHAVNYWLFGYIGKLCNYRLSMLLDAVLAYRTYRWLDARVRGNEQVAQDPLEIKARQCWTKAGYKGVFKTRGLLSTAFSIEGPILEQCHEDPWDCAPCPAPEYDGELTARWRYAIERPLTMQVRHPSGRSFRTPPAGPDGRGAPDQTCD